MQGTTIRDLSQSRANFSHQPGLTLIELLITLSVIAIIAGLSTPSFVELIQRNRIAAAANELVAGIQLARQFAVTENAVTRICPSASGQRCDAENRWDQGWIIFHDPDNNGQPNCVEDIVRVGHPLDGLVSDSAGRTSIRFLPTGFASGTNLTIKLCDPNNPENARAVIVSNPGRPRVAELPGHLSCPAT